MQFDVDLELTVEVRFLVVLFAVIFIVQALFLLSWLAVRAGRRAVSAVRARRSSARARPPAAAHEVLL